jgi:hypothetical protein
MDRGRGAERLFQVNRARRGSAGLTVGELFGLD